MVKLDKSDIQLFLTNSDYHKNAAEVFHYLCEKIRKKEKICATSTETDGEILYIGILIKQSITSQKEKDIIDWIKVCKQYKIHFDILYTNEKKEEVSALPNIHHILQEGYRHRKDKKIYTRAIVREDVSKKFTGERKEQKEQKERKKQMGTKTKENSSQNVDEKRSHKINEEEEEEDKELNQLKNDMNSSIQLKTTEIENIPEEYLSEIEGIFFLIEFPLTISQKYLKKQLTLRVQLRAANTQAKGKQCITFFNENYRNGLGQIFEEPPMFLNNMDWSSAFTSSALCEMQKKRDKEKMWKTKRKKKK